jgi:hypothetical protein
MGSTPSYLDITARQEESENSPEGYPQTPPYKWWNWHDEYAGNASPVPRWSEVEETGLAAQNLDNWYGVQKRPNEGQLFPAREGCQLASHGVFLLDSQERQHLSCTAWAATERKNPAAHKQWPMQRPESALLTGGPVSRLTASYGCPQFSWRRLTFRVICDHAVSWHAQSSRRREVGTENVDSANSRLFPRSRWWART